MGLFNGRHPGAAVTYTGSSPGLLGAADRPHGLAVAQGEHGIIVARYDRWLVPTRYDVKFGPAMVKRIPASELMTDRWGEAIPALADRPGSFGGAVDRLLLEDPLAGCLAGWMVRAVGVVMVLTYALAGMAWLGGRVWYWRYGSELVGTASRTWVGAAVLIGPIAALCMVRGFVFPRLGAAVSSLFLAVAGWMCWYFGSTANGSALRPVSEATIVAAGGSLLVVANLLRLRGDDLHPAWFWYPLATLFGWIAVQWYRVHPVPGWDAPGSAWTVLTTMSLIGAAVYLWSVAVHQTAAAAGPRLARQAFGAMELLFATALPLLALTLEARSIPGFVHGIPYFGAWGEALIMFPFALVGGSMVLAAILWLGWRPLLAALRRRRIADRRWERVRSCSYIVPLALMVLYRYL